MPLEKTMSTRKALGVLAIVMLGYGQVAFALSPVADVQASRRPQIGEDYEQTTLRATFEGQEATFVVETRSREMTQGSFAEARLAVDGRVVIEASISLPMNGMVSVSISTAEGLYRFAGRLGKGELSPVVAPPQLTGLHSWYRSLERARWLPAAQALAKHAVFGSKQAMEMQALAVLVALFGFEVLDDYSWHTLAGSRGDDFLLAPASACYDQPTR